MDFLNLLTLEAKVYSEPLTEAEQLANYQKLKELNSDFVGWLKLSDTQLDYPVMQSKDRPDFYINHDFFKNASSYGALYVSEKCELLNNPSSNIIIHGHHMRDNEMFGVLGDYKDKHFYENHRQIRFDTLSGLATYEIIGFFETDLISDNFRYYDYVGGEEELFNSYINNVKRRAFYETEATPVYGRQLLTLSTCHYYKEDVRLVLVAQRND